MGGEGCQFPDSHKFYYKNVTAGYKMVGNAVPPNLAYFLAEKIIKDLWQDRWSDGEGSHRSITSVEKVKLSYF
ncbi:MAG: hypothetical protein DRG30_10605 [Epsilonproteobacteria bacterium]|nr:MAG: hypothetical protein DRG30_10605 [Campylobacterota bacterium]